jgi:hypothetical protein
MINPLFLGLLGDHVGESVFVAALAIVTLLRFRRAKQVGAATVGILSSAATTTVIVVVSLFGLVALGYWDPPVGTIVGDALSAGRTAYDLVGKWLLDQLVGALERVAD